MPTVDWNRATWNEEYSWKEAGEEWSRPWGNSIVQWFGMLLPRVARYLPAATILEIAPGFGRWTSHLVDQCDRLLLVDLSERCIATCQERFDDHRHVEYFVNDGKTLPAVADESVDFVFSFDSLVHADQETIDSYICEIRRVLKVGGSAFLHHSNVGACTSEARREARLARVPWLTNRLKQRGLVDEISKHLRDPHVCAASVAASARRHGISCRSQECVNWRTRRALIDCFTVLNKTQSTSQIEPRRFDNRLFMRDADQLRRVASTYH